MSHDLMNARPLACRINFFWRVFPAFKVHFAFNRFFKLGRNKFALVCTFPASCCWVFAHNMSLTIETFLCNSGNVFPSAGSAPTIKVLCFMALRPLNPKSSFGSMRLDNQKGKSHARIKGHRMKITIHLIKYFTRLKLFKNG